MQRQWEIKCIEATAVTLFFIQAVRVLFSILFGVIYDALFVGPFTLGAIVANVLVVAAFVAPVLTPRRPSAWFVLVVAVLTFLARVPLTINDPQVRLYMGVLTVAAGGLYLASLLQTQADLFPLAFILALALDQVFRAWGNTFDMTLAPAWMPVQTLLSLALCWLSSVAFRTPREAATASRLGVLGGLALGAVLFLETSLLSLPNALARWSGWSYEWLTPLLLLITLLPLFLYLSRAQWPLGHLRVWGIFLVVATCLGLAEGFMTEGLASALALLMAQWAVLTALSSILRPAPLNGQRVGPRLALGWFFFLLINFANAFAFTYPYTLELFRGVGLPVFLTAGLLATLPVALRGLHLPQFAGPLRRSWLAAAMVLLVVLSAFLARAPVSRLKEQATAIRVGTYNIHYGYNTYWNFSLEEMARTIEESGADIVALQEVDTGRITSYCVDDALWLARRLRMGVLYLPTIEHLTGIGLLYRFPLESADGQLLTSRLEQTGIVRARLRVGDRPLAAYGIWLGLEPEERAVQIREALEWVTEGPAVFAGDMNSTPDSPVYRQMVAAGFVDPFIAGGFDPAPTDPAESPAKRIDFVWLRGLTPTDARVLPSTASDHRMVVVEARWK